MATNDGAISRYDRPYEIVSAQIDAMSNRADSALNKAYATLDKLAGLTSELDLATPAPNISLPNVDIDAFPVLTPPDANKFGVIGGINLPAMNIDLDALLADLDVSLDPPPEFHPSVITVDLPPRPSPIDLSGLPARPTVGNVDVPDAPLLQMPSVGNLAEISVPEFIFPDLPVFDALAPEFDGSAPSTVLQWAEPQYSSDTLPQVKSRISAMLAGGTGLPPAVEQALFDRARVREDQAGNKAVEDAFQDFAGRGFMLPPGMLAKRIDAVREQSSLKVSELAREILIKSAEWEIENLRNAVQQGIALETMLIQQFNQVVNRAFDSAKLRLESDIALYNSAVTLFNARQSAYQVEADVYRTKLQGALAKLDVYKARIEGEKAKGELNDQTVRIYTAQLQAISTQIDVYKARMEGAQVQADLEKSKIEAYSVDVRAYGERLNAQKTEFDAYEAGVRAEQAKIGILEAESRAFAATIQAYESKNNVKIQAVKAKVDVTSAKITQYNSLLDAERARVQAELANVQALTSAYQADVGRYSAEINASTSKLDLQARTGEARLRNNLAFYEIELKKYDAALARAVQKVQLQSEAMKATGTMAAQLAAGAMSATNVSASMSGSAGISSSDSLGISHSHEYREK
ncbi:MAG: hypothetical protein K2Y25_09360 [Pseudomonadaceae bacterium]|nr:hypothetical protein [Pseudomonadaceae bacterium]